MLWLFCFLAFSKSQEIVELARIEKELEIESIFVSDLIHTLRDKSQESYIMSLHAQLNYLRESFGRIQKNLDVIDKFSSEIAEKTLKLDEEMSKEIVNSFDTMSEKIAALEARIVEHDDELVTQKIKKIGDDHEDLVKQLRSKQISILEVIKRVEKDSDGS